MAKEDFVHGSGKRKTLQRFFPLYPVADAVYGSFNNYLYGQEHGMEKHSPSPDLFTFRIFRATIASQQNQITTGGPHI